jgi:hypothetical protein
VFVAVAAANGGMFHIHEIFAAPAADFDVLR